ncbi:MAG: hypothetical protein ACI4QA_06510 [Candidatus Spyradosoma sp.]
MLPILLRRARGKKTLKVVFTAWNVSMWKYHSVYRLMEKHPRFDPVVVLTPSPGFPLEARERDLAEMRKVFSERGYRIHPTIFWDERRLVFDKSVKADILCFTQPYFPKNLTRFTWNKIFCYCPYGFPSAAAEKWQHNNFMQNVAWKIFHERQETIEAAKTCTLNKAKNCVAVGYSFGDELSAERAERNPWKLQSGTPKRVIWSPHFSIADNAIFHLSNFLRLHEAMLELAEEFRGKIQWAFKPHPFLLPTLSKPEFWGRERAEAYFEKWKNMPNGQVELGAYADLFASSDAIVHDCGSFTIEYLYTRKPAMYLRIPGCERNADDLGNEALSCYYQGSEKAQIRRFLEDVVLGGNDPMRERRERFYEKYLKPPHRRSVAQNILDEIERGLGWK